MNDPHRRCETAVSKALLLGALLMLSLMSELTIGSCNAADLPMHCDFNISTPGYPPTTSPLPNWPTYLLNSPTGFIAITPSSLGLIDQPCWLFDTLGEEQALIYEAQVEPNRMIDVRFSFSIDELVNGKIAELLNEDGDVIQNFSLRDSGGVRALFPFDFDLGSYDPGQPMRIRLLMEYPLNTVRVWIDDEMNGFSDDMSYQVPMLSTGLFAQLIVGLDLSQTEFETGGTPCAIDDVRIAYFPEAPFEHWPFIRGDANQDTLINLNDAIAIFGSLLIDGAANLNCESAADINDNGAVDIADVVHLIGHLFVPGTSSPATPYPNCGYDLTQGTTTCLSSVSCP